MAYRSDLYKTAKFNFPGVTFAALLLQGRTGRPSTLTLAIVRHVKSCPIAATSKIIFTQGTNFIFLLPGFPEVVIRRKIGLAVRKAGACWLAETLAHLR